MKLLKIHKTFDTTDPGYIYAPYIMKEHTPESLAEYDKFAKLYGARHQVCPKCGSKIYSTTLVAYVKGWGNIDEYKNLNRCICQNCGSIHTNHDMISEEEFKARNNESLSL